MGGLQEQRADTVRGPVQRWPGGEEFAQLSRSGFAAEIHRERGMAERRELGRIAPNYSELVARQLLEQGLSDAAGSAGDEIVGHGNQLRSLGT